MRIAWVLVVCLGCRQLLGIDEPALETPIDAPQQPMPADAAGPICQAAGPPTASQFLGGNAGQPQPALTCPDRQLPIGMGFTSTAAAVAEGGGVAGERVVTGVGVQCGTVSESPNGDLALTPTILRTFGGSLMCNGYAQTVPAAVVDCPPNTVLVGLVGNGGKVSLFNTVAIVCAPFGPFGPMGASVSVPVTDTGSFSNNPQQAQCNDGLAVTGFAIQSGCGIDELAPDCAPLACQ